MANCDSRLEHGAEPKLSTIRRIVEALSGRFEIVARFDERDDVLLAQPIAFELYSSLGCPAALALSNIV